VLFGKWLDLMILEVFSNLNDSMTSEGRLLQCHLSSRTTYSRLPRTMSRWLLNVSSMGHSTTSLGNLCQCLVALTLKK